MERKKSRVREGQRTEVGRNERTDIQQEADSKKLQMAPNCESCSE